MCQDLTHIFIAAARELGFPARYVSGYFHRADGVVRQVLAIVASPDRTEGLRHLETPTLVIHGEDDPLVALSGGQATAAAVRGSSLMTIPGMGHDLPTEVWPEVVAAIASLAEVGQKL